MAQPPSSDATTTAAPFSDAVAAPLAKRDSFKKSRMRKSLVLASRRALFSQPTVTGQKKTSGEPDDGRTTNKFTQDAVSAEEFYDLPFVGSAAQTDEATCTFGMLRPQSSTKILWDLLIFALVLVVLTTIPLEVAFELTPTGAWFAWELCVDCIFVVDIAINCRTGFIDDQNREILEFWPAMREYARFWLWPDLLSAFPFGLLLAAYQGIGAIKALRIGKLFKAVRIMRITKLARFFKAAKMRTVIADLEDYSQTVASHYVAILLKFLIVTFFVVHFIACSWHGLGRSAGKENWQDAYGSENFSVASQYLTAAYWAITVMTTVGFGDIVPVTHSERGFAMACMLLGGVFYGFVVASAGALLRTMDSNSIKLREKMNDIDSFMRNRHFPHDLRHRIRRFFRHYYTTRTALDEEALLAELSPQLREEVSVFIVHDLVHGSSLFAELPRIALSKVTMLLKPCHFSSGNCITKRDAQGSRIFYILIKGNALEFDDTGEPLHRLVPGAVIGDECGLAVEPGYSAEVVAYSDCEMYMLPGSKLSEKLGKDAYETLRKTCRERAMHKRRHRAWWAQRPGTDFSLDSARRRGARIDPVQEDEPFETSLRRPSLEDSVESDGETSPRKTARRRPSLDSAADASDSDEDAPRKGLRRADKYAAVITAAGAIAAHVRLLKQDIAAETDDPEEAAALQAELATYRRLREAVRERAAGLG